MSAGAAPCRPHAAVYDAGPYKVLKRGPKHFTIQVGLRQEVISVDCLKPHLGATPVAPAQPPARGCPRTASRGSHCWRGHVEARKIHEHASTKNPQDCFITLYKHVGGFIRQLYCTIALTESELGASLFEIAQSLLALERTFILGAMALSKTKSDEQTDIIQIMSGSLMSNIRTKERSKNG